MELPPEYPRVDSIITKTKEILSQATERSVEKLRPFVTLQPEEDELFACFELFNGQDYGMNYNKFFPPEGGDSDDLDVLYDPLDEDGESFLPELHDFEKEWFRGTELTEAEGVEWTKKLTELFAQWFAECWEAAGGRDSTIPTYFCFEKEDICRDMFTGEILTHEEAARRAGYSVE